jgi:Ca2+-binding EF-hand superfamily protein
MTNFDADKNGEIDIREFRTFLSFENGEDPATVNVIPLNVLRFIMDRKYDLDKNGSINKQELRCYAEKTILEGDHANLGAGGKADIAKHRSEACKKENW